MPDQTILFIVFGLVAFLIGLAKGGFGGMTGGLSTPLLTFVLPPDTVVGLLLPVLMIADVFAVTSHWRHWKWRLVYLLLPGSVVGIIIGTLFITNAPTAVFRTVLGGIVVVFGIYKWVENRFFGKIQLEAKPWHGLTAGTVAGFSSTLAHAGGPPVSVYLLLQDITPRQFIASSALFFAILNWVKVPFYAYAGLFDFGRLLDLAWLLWLLPVGVWAGKWASQRVSPQRFEKIISGLLVLTGLLLILT